jgi:hypothetical protein
VVRVLWVGRHKAARRALCSGSNRKREKEKGVNTEAALFKDRRLAQRENQNHPTFSTHKHTYMYTNALWLAAVALREAARASAAARSSGVSIARQKNNKKKKKKLKKMAWFPFQHTVNDLRITTH